MIITSVSVTAGRLVLLGGSKEGTCHMVSEQLHGIIASYCAIIKGRM